MSRLLRESIEAIVLALLVLSVILFSVQNFKVEGSSMKPTLEEGQFLLVNKLVYFRVDLQRLSQLVPFWDISERREVFLFHPPRRGEVVIFHYPLDPKRDFVKRVVALPGEQIEIREGIVYIDGRPLEESYLKGIDTSTPRARENLNEWEYFVMGDNRPGSNDSRHWGPVPLEEMVGRVWCVYWPIPIITCL